MLHLRLPILLLASACLVSAPADAHGPGAGRHGKSVRAPSATRAVWVPGHHERVETRRWVPGGTRREWIPARTRRVCTPWGSVREVVLSPGRWVLVPLPGRYETCYEEVWVPGEWTHVPC
jgi:hypothetical protein